SIVGSYAAGNNTSDSRRRTKNRLN
ncbi:hypothetical protein JDF658_24680, partial [Carboxydocella sp. JDF658]